LRRLVAALLVAAVLLAGAWFLLLRPAIRSTATEAVEKPLKTVADKAESAGKKADDAKETADNTEAVVNSGGGPPSSAPPSTGAVKISTAPVTVNLQTNLGASATAKTDKLTVKAKTTLIVTDLVLQNPQGDAGRVDVIVDDKAILTLSLANFRDLDYHFVSPIQINSGKVLALRTVCQTPGPPIVGTTAGQCRVSMFATGTNRIRSK
jgi:hypothetical protein